MSISSKPKSRAIGFTPEDVEANRQGKLTDRQSYLRDFDPELAGESGSGVFLIPGFVIWSVLICANSHNSAALQCLCIIPIFFPPLFVIRRDDKKPKRRYIPPAQRVVLQTDGKPVIKQTAPETTYLRIHGVNLKIRPETAAFFVNPGTYRVYYLSGPGVFLSAEYLGDGLFK
ncbi:MAG TPA: hypothetical protein VHL11_06800 [Phototrophicaceae bacterium]|jgi:hypothetical protein|nr:hypothetical protein [Phototrophicaceae bacterium]